MTELQFLGAAGCVTGSMHLLRHNDATLSLDCGLFQGHRFEARDMNERFPLPAGEIQRVLLTHAHIDHSGRLPLLVKRGFAGPIHATPASRDLCQVMLPDSGHIQQEDADFWNRKRASNGDRISPLYSVQDALATLPYLRPAEYGERFEIFPGGSAVFIEAGHILGSAMVLVEIGGDGWSSRLLYTGDLGQFQMPIINDPTEPLPECDYLITESTYAGRTHGKPADMKDRLGQVIRETQAVGGKVIIPAFSVGRTQALLYYLFQLRQEGQLGQIPVFVDSPLSAQATEIFSNHPECFDVAATKMLQRNGDFFHQDGLVKYVTDVGESKALNDRKQPCIIISASGMCESGRILHHLANNVEDPANTVLVVGYMAQHTLGRRIVERREELKIFGRLYKLLARVEVLNGFSAHADQDEFKRLLRPLAPKLRKAFVVHGEDAQPQAMQRMLSEWGCREVIVPVMGQKARI